MGTLLTVIGAIVVVIVGSLLVFTIMDGPDGYPHDIVIKNIGDVPLDFELYFNDEMISNGTIAAHSEYVYTLICKQGDNVLTLFVDGERYEKVYGGGGFGGPGAMPETIYFIVGVI